jgi:hypothetical protein
MADGDNLILGTENNASSQTSLNRTGFRDDTSGLYGLYVQALDGHAPGAGPAEELRSRDTVAGRHEPAPRAARR